MIKRLISISSISLCCLFTVSCIDANKINSGTEVVSGWYSTLSMVSANSAHMQIPAVSTRGEEYSSICKGGYKNLGGSTAPVRNGEWVAYLCTSNNSSGLCKFDIYQTDPDDQDLYSDQTVPTGNTAVAVGNDIGEPGTFTTSIVCVADLTEWTAIPG